MRVCLYAEKKACVKHSKEEGIQFLGRPFFSLSIYMRFDAEEAEHTNTMRRTKISEQAELAENHHHHHHHQAMQEEVQRKKVHFAEADDRGHGKLPAAHDSKTIDAEADGFIQRNHRDFELCTYY
ncbi:hypothetical protein M569_03357 [Genlisea aurea]|uniref:Uncharacterized protein n=1 Tax=Genlisea aurea TaxID=192259 RepID=S8EFM7_9LAMI|nr:hypothetical protein M569_03357 [Genlisea aurea]